MSTNNSRADNSHGSIVKATSILTFGTLLSRILGFVRDIVFASILGTGADAFFVAFKIPNLFRAFVGEGATNSAVVPVFVEYYEKNEKKDFFEFVRIVITWGFLIVTGITALGVIFAPLLIAIATPGFIKDPVNFSLAVNLTRLMFPYLIFISLTAYFMGLLFTLRSFKVAALQSCFLNMAIIISAFISSHYKLSAVYCLSFGVIVGGLLQFLSQLIQSLRKGFVYKIPKQLYHQGAIRIGKLMVPRMVGSGIYQINVLVDTFCASLSFIVGMGGISAIYFANRLVQFPLGVFGLSLASAALPALSSHAHKKEYSEFKNILVFSLENVFFVLMPCTIFLMIFARPIIQILFQRGAFNFESTIVTSDALFYYSIGLFSYCANKILVSAFHAFQDTKTPVKIAGICLFVNAILNFILMFPMKIGGIALASSIAGILNFMILYYIMHKRINDLSEGIREYFVKVLIASFLMGSIMILIWNNLFINAGIYKLAFTCFVGFFSYFVITVILRLKQSAAIIDLFKRRIRG